ncbi:MAG: hypothetical protein WCL59_10085 [Cyanobium sp. ELA507]
MSLSSQERHRLASLLAAASTLLLLCFALAVALPLLPPKLADPFWQLSFTTALCSNGFLALLAVLLLNLAAALLPEADWLAGRRQLVGGLCRWVAFAYLLLIPLQGLAAWRALDWAGAAESRDARQELARIAQFRQAVVSADSVAALQVNLAGIQAPPLGSVDQSQSLAAIKSGLLAQLQAVEQRAKATSGGQVADGSGSVPGKALDPAKLLAFGKDCLRVVLLSLGFALAFAAAAQRKGSALSLLAERRLAAERMIRKLQKKKQLLHQKQNLHQQLNSELQQWGSTSEPPLNSQRRTPDKASPTAGTRSGSRQ